MVSVDVKYHVYLQSQSLYCGTCSLNQAHELSALSVYRQKQKHRAADAGTRLRELQDLRLLTSPSVCSVPIYRAIDLKAQRSVQGLSCRSLTDLQSGVHTRAACVRACGRVGARALVYMCARVRMCARVHIIVLLDKINFHGNEKLSSTT